MWAHLASLDAVWTGVWRFPWGARVLGAWEAMTTVQTARWTTQTWKNRSADGGGAVRGAI